MAEMYWYDHRATTFPATDQLPKVPSVVMVGEREEHPSRGPRTEGHHMGTSERSESPAVTGVMVIVYAYG